MRTPRRSTASTPMCALTQVLDDIMISNGLAWSPDGRTMYHADTPTRDDPRVRLRRRDRHAVDAARVRALATAETDRPDGGAVDSAGHYWTAFYRGGQRRARSRRQAHVLARVCRSRRCARRCARSAAPTSRRCT